MRRAIRSARLTITVTLMMSSSWFFLAAARAPLGDLACWFNDKHAELHVIKATAFISIELRRSENPTEPIIGVMKKALAKLK